MEKINGEWYMMGCEKSDPKLLRTADDLLELLRHIGFLPLFAGGIAGFSVEERTSASSWWSGDSQSDPWEWRIALAGHPKVSYGKFFDKRAGFIHRDFFPIFANYRRNGYDFDALSDEGLVPHRAKRIMDVFELNDEAIGNEIMSNALKEKAGFGKEGGEKNFEGVLTELQMQTYLIVSDFRQRINKTGEPFGWHIAAMGTPETKWGYDFISSRYSEEPSASWDRISEQIRRFFPDAEESEIQKVLGIKHPRAELSSVKPQKKTTPKPSKPRWPENILQDIQNVPLTLNEDQMAGLRHVISTLPQREQMIIRQYYEKYMSQKAISEMIGVTDSCIGYNKAKAIQKLRHDARSDYIRYGLKGNTRRIEKIRLDCMCAKSRAEQIQILQQVTLDDSGMPLFAKFKLRNMKIHTLGDVMEAMDKTPSELLNLNKKHLTAIADKLVEHGVDCSEVYVKLKIHQPADIYNIWELGFSFRTCNILYRGGLRTVDQLERLIKNEPEKILQLRGLGEKSRADLISTLERAGIDSSPIRNLRK